MEILKAKRRIRLKKNLTHISQLKNGHTQTSVPSWIAQLYRMDKDTILKWSDGGQNRIIVETIKGEVALG